MRNIQLYDTYEGRKRPFVPLTPGKVDIYYCGPTVYNYVHLGNFRPTVTFDLLSRFLKEEGYEVRLVSNYTDIDDKIIREAQAEKKTEKELSDFYIAAYEECLEKLNIEPLYAHPRASQYIPAMVSFIEEMLKNDSAYKAGDDTLFRVESDPTYGALSKTKVDDLEAGARIDVDGKKKSPLDFALWKKTDDAGIKFDTPLGLGRPGWHTECVVMVNDVFGKPLIDIHGGGFDLKFPHHENEIAQSEAVNHTRLANYWMHVGFLLTNGVKMSKSLGNSILAKDVLARYSGNAVRLFFEGTYYRAPVNYTEENLQSAEKQATKYQNALRKAKARLELLSAPEGKDLPGFGKAMDALSDDLNTANAIAALDGEIKSVNALSMKKDVPAGELSDHVHTALHIADVLGLKFALPSLTEEERAAFKDYEEARARKDYARSDELRAFLLSRGLL